VSGVRVGRRPRRRCSLIRRCERPRRDRAPREASKSVGQEPAADTARWAAPFWKIAKMLTNKRAEAGATTRERMRKTPQPHHKRARREPPPGGSRRSFSTPPSSAAWINGNRRAGRGRELLVGLAKVPLGKRDLQNPGLLVPPYTLSDSSRARGSRSSGSNRRTRSRRPQPGSSWAPCGTRTPGSPSPPRAAPAPCTVRSSRPRLACTR